LDDDELAALLATPADRWVDDFAVGQPELLRRLARRGLVLSDEAWVEPVGGPLRLVDTVA
jgi:hypothetical protein